MNVVVDQLQNYESLYYFQQSQNTFKYIRIHMFYIINNCTYIQNTAHSIYIKKPTIPPKLFLKNISYFTHHTK